MKGKATSGECEAFGSDMRMFGHGFSWTPTSFWREFAQKSETLGISFVLLFFSNGVSPLGVLGLFQLRVSEEPGAVGLHEI